MANAFRHPLFMKASLFALTWGMINFRDNLFLPPSSFSSARAWIAGHCKWKAAVRRWSACLFMALISDALEMDLNPYKKHDEETSFALIKRNLLDRSRFAVLRECLGDRSMFDEFCFVFGNFSFVFEKLKEKARRRKTKLPFKSFDVPHPSSSERYFLCERKRLFTFKCISERKEIENCALLLSLAMKTRRVGSRLVKVY